VDARTAYKPTADATAVPFMNQMPLLPLLVSRNRISALPSPVEVADAGYRI
jgi:hypothetical protein